MFYIGNSFNLWFQSFTCKKSRQPVRNPNKPINNEKNLYSCYMFLAELFNRKIYWCFHFSRSNCWQLKFDSKIILQNVSFSIWQKKGNNFLGFHTLEKNKKIMGITFSHEKALNQLFKQTQNKREPNFLKLFKDNL